MNSIAREAVGNHYNPDLMQRARERSWAALQGIRARMRPGISEEQAQVEATEVFRALGYEKIWHPILIRIGTDTTKTYRQTSDPSLRLGENDIYFIDIGVVFNGHEGDVGDTFVVGHSPMQQACADAARALFHETAEAWRSKGLNGQRLYRFAEDRAAAMGYRLNHEVKGHRVGDFPHAIHKEGYLGALDATPSSGLWILEIQIMHPTEPYGAFYEDLLSDADKI